MTHTGNIMCVAAVTLCKCIWQTYHEGNKTHVKNKWSHCSNSFAWQRYVTLISTQQPTKYKAVVARCGSVCKVKRKLIHPLSITATLTVILLQLHCSSSMNMNTITSPSLSCCGQIILHCIMPGKWPREGLETHWHRHESSPSRTGQKQSGIETC